MVGPDFNASCAKRAKFRANWEPLAPNAPKSPHKSSELKPYRATFTAIVWYPVAPLG